MKLLYLIPVLLLIPMSVYADNSIKQIINVGGTFVSGSDQQDFNLPTSVSSLDKSVIFLTFRHEGEGIMKDWVRSYELLDTSTIRIYGGSETATENIETPFEGYVIEFTADSEVEVQKGNFAVEAFLPEGEFEIPINGSAITPSTSILVWNGFDNDNDDTTYGIEEQMRTRILNSTHIGVFVFDTPNDAPNNLKWQIVDFNNASFAVQRGIGSLPSGDSEDTITPPTAINQSRTLLLTSFATDSEFEPDPDEYSMSATMVANDIVIDRDDPSCESGEGTCEIAYAWEIVEFPADFATIRHEVVIDNIETGSDVQQTIDDTIPSVGNFTNSMAIGTVQAVGNGWGFPISSTPAGSWDRDTYTIELLDSTTVRLITEDGQEESEIAYQVIEFFPQAIQPPGDANQDTFIGISCCMFFIQPVLDLIQPIFNTFLLLIKSVTLGVM